MGNPTALRALRGACISCRSSSTARPAFARPLSQLGPSRAAGKPQRPSEMDRVIDNVSAGFLRKEPYEKNLQQASSFRGLVDDPWRSIETGVEILAAQEWPQDDRHHLHIYAHKHNTHITLTKPNRDALISVSCGNIGFRKAARGSYDAAYQLAAFVMSRIQDKGLLAGTGGVEPIKSLELIYRGFGPGREAVTKAILGSEGKNIRPLINKLSDSTRLKFGGTRSKKPRRLG